MTSILRIARAAATEENLKAILDLIDEAREWLPLKGTDQWSEPWPDRKARDDRILRGLQVGATWIVWAANEPAATITMAKRPNIAVWSEADCDLDERAVYAHRLIVARRFAGWGLGSELIDWAGLRGRRKWRARWIRIDVWTSNQALHNYYMKRGFEPCGACPDPGYPSGALFQKRVSDIVVPVSPLFTEGDASSSALADAEHARQDLCPVPAESLRDGPAGAKARWWRTVPILGRNVRPSARPATCLQVAYDGPGLRRARVPDRDAPSRVAARR